jgi:hypothetical protein
MSKEGFEIRLDIDTSAAVVATVTVSEIFQNVDDNKSKLAE